MNLLLVTLCSFHVIKLPVFVLGKGLFESESEIDPSFDTPLYYAPYIARAVESGLSDADELFEITEPSLYKQG